jgi:NADP-dependent 3-hydroxy acid dehydrogenase YdfG
LNAASFAGMGAVVTGASSGVGRAVAARLGRDGAAVCVIGRDAERLEAAAREAAGATAVRADLARREGVLAAAERARDSLGRVDMLVHAAATIETGRLEHASLDDLGSQLRVNVEAPYALTQALLGDLRAARGQVVFVNSSAGRSAGAGSGQYAATKHALVAVADSLRAEVNEDGVRVLSVFLGRTATPMQEELARREGKEYVPESLVQPEDVAEMVAGALALPRTAEVTEITIRPMRKS